MYDSLLDELEDDVVARPREVEELGDKVAEAEEAEAILDHGTAETDLSASDDGNQIGATDQSIPQESEDYEGVVQEFVLFLNDQLLKLVLCDQKEVHPGGHDSEPCRRSGIRIHIPEVLHETVLALFQSVEQDRSLGPW